MYISFMGYVYNAYLTYHPSYWVLLPNGETIQITIVTILSFIAQDVFHAFIQTSYLQLRLLCICFLLYLMPQVH
jgi:hypothetical protein